MPEVKEPGPDGLFLSSVEKMGRMQAILADIIQSAVEVKDYPEEDVRRKFVIDEINSKLAEVLIHYETVPLGVFNIREHSIFSLLNFQNCKNIPGLVLNATQALGVVEFKSEREKTPINNFHQRTYLKVINLLQVFITNPSLERLIELYKITSSFLLTDLPPQAYSMHKQKFEFCVSFNIKLREHIIEILQNGPEHLHNNTLYIMEGFWRTFVEFFRDQNSNINFGTN